MRLKGRKALVTGGARGIGLAICRRFLSEGAEVVAVDINESPFGTSIKWDLEDTESLWSLVEAAEERLAGITLLANCAGICPTEPMLDSELSTWERVFKINVYAPFFLTQLFAKYWVASSCSAAVINMASVSSFLPKVEQTVYGASKAAIVSMTRSCAAVLGPHRIRVNAIAPGVIDTPLTQEIAQRRAKIRGVEPAATLAPVIEATPLRRIGDAAEIAELAVYLASDQASFITGQTIVADGGTLMR